MGISMSNSLECEPCFEVFDPETDFEERLGEYVGVLHAVALRLTRDPQRAESLVRQALASALRRRDTFTEGMYLKSWLLTILRNTFIKIDGAVPGQKQCSGSDDGSLSYYLDLKQCGSLLMSSTA